MKLKKKRKKSNGKNDNSDDNLLFPYTFILPGTGGVGQGVRKVIEKETAELIKSRKFCRHCGSKLKKGQIFCKICGNEVV